MSNSQTVSYTIHRATRPPELSAGFDAPDWAAAQEGVVSHFRPESGQHRPETRFRALYDRDRLYLRFLVCDRHVRSVHTRYQDPVSQDSCVECFLRPREDRGYFNFEMNAGGCLLLYYIEDPTRLPGGGFVRMTAVPAVWGAQVALWHALPERVDPVIDAPCTWGVACAIPMALFEAFAGPLGEPAGQRWRGNFYKCGDRTPFPHWASWSPVTQLNFHLPEDFGRIEFA